MINRYIFMPRIYPGMDTRVKANYSQFSLVQSLSCVRLFVTPWMAARQAFLSVTNSQSLLKLMCNQVGDAIQPSYPLLPPSPPSFNLSLHQGLCTLHIRWPKYWSFSFSISPSNEYSGLISFRIDWLDLLVVKGFSRVFSNTTIQKHQFFRAQLSSQSNSHIHT